MLDLALSKTTLCLHQVEKQRSGIALITIGNPLRKDDGIASIVADGLSLDVKEELCRFDLETYSQFLMDCLVYHQVAVIIDATAEKGKAGELTILDLTAAMELKNNIDVKSCHGLSFMDELKMARNQNFLPEKVYFFGIEAENTDWGKGLSMELETKKEELTKRLEQFLKSIFIQIGL